VDAVLCPSETAEEKPLQETYYAVVQQIFLVILSFFSLQVGHSPSGELQVGHTVVYQIFQVILPLFILVCKSVITSGADSAVIRYANLSVGTS
jgi:hypothetical protein